MSKSWLQKGSCFDFGPGWAVVDSAFPGSRLGVCLHIQSGEVLNSFQCSKLAGFLKEAEQWLDNCDEPTDPPLHPVIYVITDGHSHHKVGKANNFERRLKQLQTGNGRRLRLVAYLRVNDDHLAYVAESAAKSSLQEFRAVGEWFACNSHNAFQALHDAAHTVGIAYRPISVCVGHEDDERQEATDGQ